MHHKAIATAGSTFGAVFTITLLSCHHNYAGMSVHIMHVLHVHKFTKQENTQPQAEHTCEIHTAPVLHVHMYSQNREMLKKNREIFNLKS